MLPHCNENEAIEKMKSLIPKGLASLIEKDAGKLIDSNLKYTLMLILRSGDDLDLIACYMAAVVHKKLKGLFPVLWKKELTILCKKKKFNITKLKLRDIIERAKKNTIK